MAIFHFSVASVSRRAGQSAVRSSAYITGTRQVDERTGRVANYTRKAKEVQARGTVGTVDWQQTERAERRKDSKVARSIIVALPAELDLRLQRTLVSRYATWLRQSHGMALEWAIHAAPGDPRNIHAHLLLTTREVDDDGVHGRKLRALDCAGTSRHIIKRWRQSWQDHCNDLLGEYTLNTHIDCRSLANRGISRPPHRHLGPEQSSQHRRGYATAAGRFNLKVDEYERLQKELEQINQAYERNTRSRRRRTDRAIAGSECTVAAASCIAFGTVRLVGSATNWRPFDQLRRGSGQTVDQRPEHPAAEPQRRNDAGHSGIQNGTKRNLHRPRR